MGHLNVVGPVQALPESRGGRRHGHHEVSNNVRRKGLCSLEVAAEIAKLREFTAPKEATRLMDR